MKPTRVLSLVLAAATLEACTLSPLVIAPLSGGGAPGAGGNLISNGPAAAMTTVRGAVTAPSTYVAVGGDPFTSGGSLIAAGGLNYRLQASDEQPLAGAEVYLADGQGNPLAGLPSAITNGRGEFTFPGVPAAYTYMVVARARSKDGKPVSLRTLVTGKDGRGDIDAASTLATEAVTEGASMDLGQLDPERFRKVRDTIRQDLAQSGIPDLGDRAAVAARIDKLKAQNGELRDAMEAMRTDLQKARAELDTLRKELEARPPQPLAPLTEQRPLSCLEAFKLRDKNQDGAVDVEEAGAPANFRQLDRNGDGKIQLEEVCEAPIVRPEPLDCKTRFAQLDQNGDGVLEIQEAPNSLPGQPNHPQFQAQDLNGDMKVTLEEFCRKPEIGPAPVPCEAIFKRGDADGDGLMSIEEAARILPTVNKVEAGTATGIAIDEPGVQRAQRLDRNGDGQLSLDEFCERPGVGIDPVPCEETFKRADLDGDGIITYEESLKLDAGQTGDPNVRFLKEHDRDGDAKLTLAEACGGQVPGPTDPCGEKFAGLAGPDGVLSYEEAVAASMGKERFVALDRSGDGLIDRREFCETVTIQPVEPTCQDRFARLAGTDGLMSYEEAMAAGIADAFKKYDLNADGFVGPREWAYAFCGEPMPSPTPAPPTETNPCDDKFKRAAGPDGAINPEDIGALGWTKDQFYKYDFNKDGKVDRREWGWAMCQEPMPEPIATPNPCDEKFKRAAGADGAITLDEIALLGWIKDQFYKYDLNKDGKVDRREWGWAMCQEPMPILTTNPTVDPIATIR